MFHLSVSSFTIFYCFRHIKSPSLAFFLPCSASSFFTKGHTITKLELWVKFMRTWWECRVSYLHSARKDNLVNNKAVLLQTILQEFCTFIYHNEKFWQYLEFLWQFSPPISFGRRFYFFRQFSWEDFPGLLDFTATSYKNNPSLSFYLHCYSCLDEDVM